MNSDAYIFFTECHRLFIKGVRGAIREHLEGAFGEEWWEKGVAHALQLQEEQLQNLNHLIEREPDRDRHLFLDVTHFSHIIANHHDQVFSRAFGDSLRTFKDFRLLTALRNEWAHVQELPIVRARQAAQIMKGILASLNCEEALEVERMSQGFSGEPGTDVVDDSIEYWDDQDPGLARQESGATPWEFWRQIQSYLMLEKSVEPQIDRSTDQVRVVIRVHNTAPNSRDLPTVHFKSVTINIGGGGGKDLGEMRPGESRQAEFTFPEKGLMGLEFEVTGIIDSDELFHFRRATSLPDEIIVPLRREFVTRFEAIGVRSFVKEVLDGIGTPDSSMTLADISRVRGTLKEQPELIKAKRTELTQFFRDFHLDRNSTLGARVREIIQTLEDFERKLADLDEAIGHTNLDSINEAVSDLKQIQLAVLRVEDTVRTLATGN